MSLSELATRYRELAASCIEIAQGFSDQASKLSLISMAQSWIALAERAENGSG